MARHHEEDQSALKIGSPVWVRRNSKKEPHATLSNRNSDLSQGVVAYLGKVHFAPGDDWVGVRLTGSSSGQGRNNGTVEGMTYFQTEDSRGKTSSSIICDGRKSGLFVRKSCVTLRQTPVTPIKTNPAKKNTPLISPSCSPNQNNRSSKRSRTLNHNANKPNTITPIRNKNNKRASKLSFSPHYRPRASLATEENIKFYHHDPEQQERYDALMRWKQAKREGRPFQYEPSVATSSLSSKDSLVGRTIEFEAERQSPGRNCIGGVLFFEKCHRMADSDQQENNAGVDVSLLKYRQEHPDEDRSVATGSSTITSCFHGRIDEKVSEEETQRDYSIRKACTPKSSCQSCKTKEDDAENVPPTRSRDGSSKRNKKRWFSQNGATSTIKSREPCPGKAQQLREKLRALEKWRGERRGQSSAVEEYEENRSAK